MSSILKPGQIVQTEATKRSCTVLEFLRSGDQGEVYRTELGSTPRALKWYRPTSATDEQRASLETLIEKGPPDARFLWPLDLVSAEETPGFGYIMPLMEARYQSMAALMKRRAKATFRVLATAGFNLAHALLQLHAKGLCHRDISFVKVFLDPDTGDIHISDNDNVALDGKGGGPVLSNPRFMAPEVVRGDAAPGIQTDLFSLAVLLFYVFVVHHPLDGKRELDIHCLDLPAMNKLYGTDPLFIFDPDDKSNQPVPGYQDNALTFWPLYPQFLRDLFTQAFTKGIRDPQNGRVRESEWQAAMVRLRDSIVYCAACGAENFYDADALRASDGKPGACWACGTGIKLPPRIRIGNKIVMLNHDTQLFPHHVDDQKLYDFSLPVAAVTQHPQVPTTWGLENLSGETWVVTTAGGAARDVEPGRSARLALGIKVNFGKAEGEVRL